MSDILEFKDRCSSEHYKQLFFKYPIKTLFLFQIIDKDPGSDFKSALMGQFVKLLPQFTIYLN